MIHLREGSRKQRCKVQTGVLPLHNCLGRSAHRVGGVLFEVMLSLALFAGAATFTLGAVRSVFATLERSALQQEAVDVARSRIAELEAGLISLTSLRDGNAGDASHEAPQRWLLDAKTSRTQYPNLTLVELTVSQNSQDSAAVRVTLRQLIELRAADAAAAGSDEVGGSP